MPWKQGFKILLVDDSRDDTFFIRNALEKAGMGKMCTVVENGEEAIKYLRGDEPYSERATYPFPTVVLSDLNMPRMNGFELLQWVRRHPDCAVIPTVLFSNSAIEGDVKRAYQMGANAYMMKPATTKEMEDLLRVTCEY
jgi:CheY-like chemotaxis protein